MEVTESKKQSHHTQERCKACGSVIGPVDNFCGECGRKVKVECNCWVKKGSYNCGEDSCPGYGLFLLEKLKSK